MSARAIGPVGTLTRALVGLFLLYLALIDGPPFADGFGWGLTWYGALLGLVVLPAIMLSAGLTAHRYTSRPGAVSRDARALCSRTPPSAGTIRSAARSSARSIWQKPRSEAVR